MEKKLINLTLSVVIEKIENILTTYQRYPYKQAFSDTGLRQDLAAYVLNRVPNKFTVLEQEALSKSFLLLLYPNQELLDIELHIHLGIREIVYDICDRNKCNRSQPYNLSFPTPFIDN